MGFAPFALLGLATGALVFGALSVVAYLAGTWWLGVRSVAVFALVLTSSVVVASLGYGTIDAFLYLGICALVRFRHRPEVAAAVVVALIALKPLMLPLASTCSRPAVCGPCCDAGRPARVVRSVGRGRLLRRRLPAIAPAALDRGRRPAAVRRDRARRARHQPGSRSGSPPVVSAVGAWPWCRADRRSTVPLDHRVVLAVSVGSALNPELCRSCGPLRRLLLGTAPPAAPATAVAAAAWIASWLIFPAPVPRLRSLEPDRWQLQPRPVGRRAGRDDRGRPSSRPRPRRATADAAGLGGGRHPLRSPGDRARHRATAAARLAARDRALFAAMNADPVVMEFFPGRDAARAERRLRRPHRGPLRDAGLRPVGARAARHGRVIGFTGSIRCRRASPARAADGGRLRLARHAGSTATRRRLRTPPCGWRSITWAAGGVVDDGAAEPSSRAVMDRIGLVHVADADHPRAPAG